MKIIVTGSRDWEDDDAIRNAFGTLSHLSSREDPITIVHGDCRGADRRAGRIALMEFGWKVIPVPVVRRLDGPWPGAGNRRNARMLKEHPDARYGFAFLLPQSVGTKNMIDLFVLHRLDHRVILGGRWADDRIDLYFTETK